MSDFFWKTEKMRNLQTENLDRRITVILKKKMFPLGIVMKKAKLNVILSDDPVTKKVELTAKKVDGGWQINDPLDPEFTHFIGDDLESGKWTHVGGKEGPIKTLQESVAQADDAPPVDEGSHYTMKESKMM